MSDELIERLFREVLRADKEEAFLERLLDKAGEERRLDKVADSLFARKGQLLVAYFQSRLQRDFDAFVVRSAKARLEDEAFDWCTDCEFSYTDLLFLGEVEPFDFVWDIAFDRIEKAIDEEVDRLKREQEEE